MEGTPAQSPPYVVVSYPSGSQAMLLLTESQVNDDIIWRKVASQVAAARAGEQRCGSALCVASF